MHEEFSLNSSGCNEKTNSYIYQRDFFLTSCQHKAASYEFVCLTTNCRMISIYALKQLIPLSTLSCQCCYNKNVVRYGNLLGSVTVILL